MRNIIVSILGNAFPFSLLQKIFTNRIIIPYFHMISDDDVIHVKHLYRYKNILQFESDLEFLLKKYQPIDAVDLIDIVKKGKSPGKPCFIPTFDDGFSEMYEVVTPILLKKGIPAIFFVNSGFIGNKGMAVQNKSSVLIEHIHNSKTISSEMISKLKVMKYGDNNIVDEMAMQLDFDMDDYLKKRKPYLSEEQLRKMSDKGFFIGSHSIDHPLYRDLGFEEQIRQTKESTEVITEKISCDYKLFAFPHTDNGVTKKYFETVVDQNIVDLTLGTSGLKEDSAKYNIQRISFEKTMDHASKVIRIQYMKKIFRILINNDIIHRI